MRPNPSTNPKRPDLVLKENLQFLIKVRDKIVANDELNLHYTTLCWYLLLMRSFHLTHFRLFFKIPPTKSAETEMKDAKNEL